MSAFTDLTEPTISRKEQYSGPLFTVHSDEVRLPNGNTSVREVIEHVDGVAVLPLDEHNNVLTVTQYRYVFGKTPYRTSFCPWAIFCPPPAATPRCCTCFWPGACTWRTSSWTRTNF